MNTLLQDFRYALRQLQRSPGFAATAVVTLMLAIGIATAAFSLFYAVIVRPLPYNQPERIVSMEPRDYRVRNAWGSYSEYLDWRRENRAFESLAGLTGGSINFEGPGGSLAVDNIEASDNFFEVFGVQPILGRTFLPGEDQPGKNDVVVLSHEIWQQHFGGRIDVLGQTIRLDARPYTVIGVMPPGFRVMAIIPGFRFPLGIKNTVYRPLHLSNNGGKLLTIGRLKPGTSLQQAQADMDSLLSQLIRANRARQGRQVVLTTMSSGALVGVSEPIRLLVLAAFAVLAIGCINVAGLLLARGTKREHEIALRCAVGASRWRIIRQLLTETLLLSLAGAAGGAWLAHLLLSATRTLLIGAMERGAELQIDRAALLAALALALLTTWIIGILPALRLSNTAPMLALRASGGGATARNQHRLRAAFVTVQIAFAFALLIASGLLLRSITELRHTNIGFNANHVLTTEISLPRTAYAGRDVLNSYYAPLLEKVKAIPGVKAAGITSLLPATDRNSTNSVHIAGQPPDPPDQKRYAVIRHVSTGYFEALGIPLKSGRMLNDRMDPLQSKPAAIVVNEAFAKTFFADGDNPIGKVIDRGVDGGGAIVGVVSSVRQRLRKTPPPEMLQLVDQIAPEDRQDDLSDMFLVIRTTVEPQAIVPSLRRAFYEVDPGVALRTPLTMPEVVESNLQFERLQNWIFGTFAALALVLAIIGLYGLVSQEVALSTREIGIQMALGASRMKVVTGIYRHVGLLLVGGLAVGLLTTFVLKKLLAAVVVVSPGKDAGVILGLAAVLMLAGLLAAVMPARRAAKVDPMFALRCE